MSASENATQYANGACEQDRCWIQRILVQQKKQTTDINNNNEKVLIFLQA